MSRKSDPVVISIFAMSVSIASYETATALNFVLLLFINKDQFWPARLARLSSRRGYFPRPTCGPVEPATSPRYFAPAWRSSTCGFVAICRRSLTSFHPPFTIYFLSATPSFIISPDGLPPARPSARSRHRLDTVSSPRKTRGEIPERIDVILTVRVRMERISGRRLFV